MDNITNQTHEDNKKLYWYGFWAKAKSFFGWICIIFGIIISLASQSIVPIICGVAIGVYLIILGAQQRFDFKRRSGIIIHNGDRK